MREAFFLTSGQLRAPAAMIASPAELAATRSQGRIAALRARVAPRIMSVTVAVVLRDDGRVVLVDAGWSEEICREPRLLGRWHAAVTGIDARPGESIASQLRGFGVPPERVRTIIATHLHLDHIGGVCDFPNAEVVTTERELKAYRTVGSRGGYRADDLARAGRLRLVPLEAGPTYGFPSSHDLFGDGSVVLLDACGHTRGSVAVALRTRDRNYVHVGDAVYQTWEYGLSPPGPSLTATITNWSRRKLRATYAALRACEVDPRRPTIVPSHDVAVFERLPHAPRASLPETA